MRKVIINVNLEYVIDEAKTNNEALIAIDNIELPISYISGSLEVVKFFDDQDNETCQ